MFKRVVLQALRDLNDLDESTALAIHNELAGTRAVLTLWPQERLP